MALFKTLDAEHLTGRLGDWLAHAVPGATGITIGEVEVPTSSGLSMTTVLFTAAYTEGGERRRLDLVARVGSEPESRLFKDMDLARDFEVVRALGQGTGIAVPGTRWIEADPAWLGQPFAVFDRVYGQVPADDPPWTATGWVMDLPPERRGCLMRNGIEVAAAIHAVDWRALGLGLLDRSQFGPPGIGQEIERFHDIYRWVAGDTPSETIDAAFDWLREHQPAGPGELVLCWGDARPGNLMYGDDDAVTGVFDWEMAALGPAEMDLGYWLFLQRHHSEAIGVPLPEGIPSREETIAYYEQASGRGVRDIDFYERFGALRTSVLMMRVGQLLIAGGALPQGHPMPFVNPSSQTLAAMLDLPVPQVAGVAVADADGGFLGARGAD